MSNKRIRNDILLIVLILLLSLSALILFLLNADDGNYVIVTLNGEEVGRYILSEDFTTDICTENDGINTLVIENSEVYLSYANCPDKICVEHRKISLDGESIICLPHKLVVTIVKE